MLTFLHALKKQVSMMEKLFFSVQSNELCPNIKGSILEEATWCIGEVPDGSEFAFSRDWSRHNTPFPCVTLITPLTLFQAAFSKLMFIVTKASQARLSFLLSIDAGGRGKATTDNGHCALLRYAYSGQFSLKRCYMNHSRVIDCCF